jgi:hypothetical protein
LDGFTSEHQFRLLCFLLSLIHFDDDGAWCIIHSILLNLLSDLSRQPSDAASMVNATD